ncbi:MAG: biotin--[acetyl-CoA-carboxylase] ligase, partial [Cetobacterium sp.]
YDSEEVIQIIVKDFFYNFKEFKNGKWNDILKKINEVNYLFGRRIDVVSSEKEESGIAGDISEDGTLEVFIGSEIKKYNVGSIHISKK